MTNTDHEDRPILVTGGAGYIGSRLIRDLALDKRFAGRTIRIYDNLQRKSYDGLMDLPESGRYQFIEGDILDRVNLLRALQGVHAVVHLAALVTTPLSFQNAEWTEQVNHWGTAGVVECALSSGVKRLVYASSASVYGPGERFSERDRCRPQGPYAVSKRRGEEEVLAAAKRSLEVTALRLGTTFGTAPAMRFDTVADRFAYLAGVQRPLVIHGSGEQIRPLIHVSDASAALCLCLDPSQSVGELLNAATVNASVNEIAAELQQILPGVRVRYTDQDRGSEFSYTLDSTRLSELGFTASHSLRQGLREMTAHWRGFQAMSPPAPEPE